MINLGHSGSSRECMTELGVNLDDCCKNRRKNRALAATAAWAAWPPVSSIAGHPGIPAVLWNSYEFGIFHQEIVDGGRSKKRK